MTYYRYLSYNLKLESPAILTGPDGDPNSASTLDYIPGSTVRGAVARALGDPKTDKAKQEEFQKLVLGGSVRYLNAYPDYEGSRSLPLPVSLQKEKNVSKKNEIVNSKDLAAYTGQPSPDHDISKIWPKEQMTRISEPFLTLADARPTLVQPQISSRFHNQRDRQKGHAWKDKKEVTHGAIFTFESLDAGQVLQGIIQIRGESEDDCTHIGLRIKELMGASMLIGRSRRAGYGGMARIHWLKDQKYEVEGAGSDAFRQLTNDIESGAEFRMLLLSNCVARHPETGQIDPAGFEKLIGTAFNGRAKLVRRRWAFITIGGFNRKWRLETPQALAVAAGSVFVLQATRKISIDDLQRIKHDGLGERKEEGYGRLLFLSPPIQSVFLHQSGNPKAKHCGQNPPSLVLEIEKRILTAQIERCIEEKAASIAETAIKLPTNSLIGRLRTALRTNESSPIETLHRWLNHEEEAKRLKRPAMDQLEKCRVAVNGDKLGLIEWLREAIKTENVLSWLAIDNIAQRYHLISPETAKKILKEQHQAFALRLIDAVLAAMALKNKTKEDAGDDS